MQVLFGERTGGDSEAQHDALGLVHGMPREIALLGRSIDMPECVLETPAKAEQLTTNQRQLLIGARAHPSHYRKPWAFVPALVEGRELFMKLTQG